MLERRGGPDFLEESVATEDGTQLGAEHLEGDLAVVPRILGQVDGGHATRADLAEELVPIAEVVLEGRIEGHSGTYCRVTEMLGVTRPNGAALS